MQSGKIKAFLRQIEQGSEAALKTAALVAGAYLSKTLGDATIRSSHKPGRFSLLVWKGIEQRRVTAAEAVEYAQAHGMPFSHPSHASNAFQKLYRLLEEICHGTPDDLVVWAVWVECVRRRNLSIPTQANTESTV